METSENERNRLKELYLKPRTGAKSCWRMNEHLEEKLEKKEKQFLIKMEEEDERGNFE